MSPFARHLTDWIIEYVGSSSGLYGLTEGMFADDYVHPTTTPTVTAASQDEPKADAKAPEAPVKVHEVPPRYEMGVLADYDMGVLFLHDTMGSWSIRCYRIEKRGVGIVGLFGDIVVSGEARSGKRIVIGGLPGDKTATVDQFYVDPPHRRHKSLRHGQQLWRLTQKLYSQAGTLRFVCTTATSKGHTFYLRMGFVVNPVAHDLVLTISVTKLKLCSTNCDYNTILLLILILLLLLNFNFDQESKERNGGSNSGANAEPPPKDDGVESVPRASIELTLAQKLELFEQAFDDAQALGGKRRRGQASAAPDADKALSRLTSEFLRPVQGDGNCFQASGLVSLLLPLLREEQITKFQKMYLRLVSPEACHDSTQVHAAAQALLRYWSQNFDVRALQGDFKAQWLAMTKALRTKCYQAMQNLPKDLISELLQAILDPMLTESTLSEPGKFVPVEWAYGLSAIAKKPVYVLMWDNVDIHCLKYDATTCAYPPPHQADAFNLPADATVLYFNKFELPESHDEASATEVDVTAGKCNHYDSVHLHELGSCPASAWLVGDTAQKGNKRKAPATEADSLVQSKSKVNEDDVRERKLCSDAGVHLRKVLQLMNLNPVS